MSIQLKRGTSAQRKNSNVVLADGQPFYEKDTKQLYIGDGSTAVKDLQSLILNAVYPVDSIYISVNPANPSTLFGGTWIAWGQGCVPVGVSANANDSDFGKVEQQGGERKHQLITSEMPAHDHRGTYTETHHHTINIPGSGDSFIEIPSGTDAVEVQYKQTQSATLARNGSRPTGNQLDITYKEKVTALYGVPSQGGNTAHNNLQPYITCYMWKRTA